jgi:hypothetical protein
MRVFITFLIFSVSGLFFSPVIADGNPDPVEELKWLDTADPVKDAHAAIESGDIRLKAVAGFTILVPGIPPQKEEEYRERFGVTVITGTSDVIESDDHARLNILATKYAEQYNEEVIKSANE